MRKKKKRDSGLITEYTGTPISIEQDQLEILSEEDLKAKKETEEKKD